MAQPITWRNVNQPNFAASNTLRLGAAKQMSDSFDSISNRFIDQGKYNEKQNTDKLIGQIGGMSDYDKLTAAKAGIFGGMEGQNVDEQAVASAFGTQLNQLGQQETFQTGRKDTADTESGVNFVRQLMDSGVTDQREIQSALMKESINKGWNDSVNKNVFQTIDRQFQPTIEEGAQAAAAESLLDHQRDLAIEAAETERAVTKARIAAGKSTSTSFGGLIDGARLSYLARVLPGDSKEEAQQGASAFLNKAADILGTKQAKLLYGRHTDDGVTDYGDAEEELEKMAAVQAQAPQIAAMDDLQKRLYIESMAKQMNISKAQVKDMVDGFVKLSTKK